MLCEEHTLLLYILLYVYRPQDAEYAEGYSESGELTTLPLKSPMSA